MNKLAIYIVVALVLASSAFALGIGAKNQQILNEGEKSIDLFIINDEHGDFVAEIAVLGSSEGIEITPSIISFSHAEEIKKFTVHLDFGKIKNYPVKIVASEQNDKNAQLSAIAKVVYKLPIMQPKTEEQEQQQEDEPAQIANEQQNIPVENELPENLPVEISDEGKTATKQFSGAAVQDSKKIEVAFKLQEGDEKKILFAGIIIVVFIFLANVFFIQRKTPLEKYITKSRKTGKTNEEIKTNLKDAGWSDLIVDNYLKK